MHLRSLRPVVPALLLLMGWGAHLEATPTPAGDALAITQNISQLHPLLMKSERPLIHEQPHGQAFVLAPSKSTSIIASSGSLSTRSGISWVDNSINIVAKLDANSATVQLVSQGRSILVERVGASAARVEQGYLVQPTGQYDRGALWVTQGRDVEELVAVGPGARELRYRFVLPPGFSMHQLPSATIEIRDETGGAFARMNANMAWSTEGQSLPVTTLLDANQVIVRVNAGTTGALVDPTWSSAGAMVVNRTAHGTAQLPDGRVLIAGGDKLLVGVTEIYDPIRHTFTGLESTSVMREGPFLYTRSDGHIIVAGGHVPDDTVPVVEIEEYSPDTSTFSVISSVPEIQDAAFAPLRGDRFAMVGGKLNGTASNTVHIIDAHSGQITSTIPLQIARERATAVAIADSKILVVGGTSDQRAELVDVDQQTTQFTGPSHTNRFGGLGALAPDGSVLIAGGKDSNLAKIPGAERWIPNTNTFRNVNGYLSETGVDAILTLPTGQQLILGGTKENASTNTEGTTVLFDPRTNLANAVELLSSQRPMSTLTLLCTGNILLTGGRPDDQVGSALLGAMPPALDTLSVPMIPAFSRSILTNEGKVFVWGQDSSTNNTSARGILWDPETGISEMVPGGPPLTDRHASLTRLASGQILVYGITSEGFNNWRHTAIFDPTLKRWLTGPSLNKPREDITPTLLEDGRVMFLGGKVQGQIDNGWAIWDENSGDWQYPLSDAQKLVQGRYLHRAVTVPGNKLLVVGGYSGNGSDNIAAELFDLGTMTSSVITNSSPQVIDFTISKLLDGDVIFGGGKLPSAVPRVFSTMLRYHVSTNSFSPIPSYFGAIGGNATLLQDGNVWLSGGHTVDDVVDGGGPYETLPIAFSTIYDSANGQLLNSSTTFTAREYHDVVTLTDGTVLVSGGEHKPEIVDFDQLSTSSPQPNTIGDKWLEGSNLSMLPTGGILVTGGRNADASYSDERTLFDPYTFSESTLSPMSTARAHHRSTLLNDGSTLISGGLGFNTTGVLDFEHYSANGSVIAPSSQELVERHSHIAQRTLYGDVLLAGGSASGNMTRWDTISQQSIDLGVPSTMRYEGAAATLASGDILMAGGIIDPESSVLQIERINAATFTVSNLATLPIKQNPKIIPNQDGSAFLFGLGLVAKATDSGVEQLESNVTTPLAETRMTDGNIFMLATSGDTVARIVLNTGEILSSDNDLPLSWDISVHVPVMYTLPDGDIALFGMIETSGGTIPGAVHRAKAGQDVPRPELGKIPSQLTPRDSVTVEAKRLHHMASAGASGLPPIAGRRPVVMYFPESGVGPVFWPVSHFDDTSITFTPTVSPFHGPGWVSVIVDGVPSRGQFTRLQPADNGAPCKTAAECGSGFCVDSVCCENSCGGSCESCDAFQQSEPAQSGKCLPIKEDTDPKNACSAEGTECGTTGECDGKGACAIADDDTVCSVNGLCKQGSCIVPQPAYCAPLEQGQQVSIDLIVPGSETRHCTPYICQNDKCLASCDTTAECAPNWDCTPSHECRQCTEDRTGINLGSDVLGCGDYVCEKGVCLNVCVTDQDCAEGLRCNENQCGAYCDDTGTKVVAKGVETDCSPYRCNTGECLNSCVTNLECAPGNICSIAGLCRTAVSAAPEQDSGCSIATPKGESKPLWELAILVSLLSGLRRRTTNRQNVSEKYNALQPQQIHFSQPHASSPHSTMGDCLCTAKYLVRRRIDDPQPNRYSRNSWFFPIAGRL